MRRAASTVAALVLAALLTGCATACPAIGWTNSVTIDAASYGPGVALQVCSDHGCSPAPGIVPTPETDASVPQAGDDGTFFFGFDAPDEITVRVYDDTGVLLAESRETIDWTHSTEPCGGPSTAPPVVLKA
ncbi:hypothetical protein AUC47_10130 [Microbacterium sp. SZ1]|uniref:hypothetical protein n=1 Tax=Microbacterium sp. SZ1 TaxID=1849736 RepID=UPI000BBB9BE5|nr:hypothetical protein [Microbacterium sp. SZ1]PCE15875.1 hypothetical protein AUC47_10130 [Microbacterium sp. SZ1]